MARPGAVARPWRRSGSYRRTRRSGPGVGSPPSGAGRSRAARRSDDVRPRSHQRDSSCDVGQGQVGSPPEAVDPLAPHTGKGVGCWRGRSCSCLDSRATVALLEGRDLLTVATIAIVGFMALAIVAAGLEQGNGVVRKMLLVEVSRP